MSDDETGRPAVHVLERLFATVRARQGGDPDSSYTARLMARGTAKMAQKLGEEAVEVVIEALRRDRAALVEESADLLYHLVVLWADADLEPEMVWRALEARERRSGIAEKKSRPRADRGGPQRSGGPADGV